MKRLEGAENEIEDIKKEYEKSDNKMLVYF